MESENAVKRSGVQTVLDQLGFGWYQVRVIIIIGTAQATDTMETLIQAILGPTLRCEWNMSSDYVALLTTLVFLGICIGSPPIGYLSDRLGRKDLNILCCLALIYMTWLCAISPTYMWLAVLRFISGLYIGGLLTAGCSMISEVLPESYQPTGQLLVCFFDSFIALYVTGVGLGCSTSKLSWRFFILFTTAPLILCALGLTYCIQESPVILAQWGNYEESAKVLDKIAKCNDRIPNIIDKENTYSSKHYSLSNYLSIVDEKQNHANATPTFKNIMKFIYNNYAIATPLLIAINFIWGMIIYGATTLLPVELPSLPRTCLQSIYKGLTEVPHETYENSGIHNEDCCLPLLKEGYISLMSSMIGSILSFPIALTLITIIGRKWTINTCFFLTAFLIFIEAFCMPSNLLRFFFFATRAVASAGNNATAIYITGLYAPRIRSFVFGVMSTCFRIGVLTAPYLGQVFLQRVSALGAVLIFSAIALIGFVFSIFLPHAGDKHFTSTTISKGVFRRIFKGNKSKTKQNDDGMKSVTNPAYKDDEKTIRTIVEEIKRKDNNKPAVLPVEQILNSTSVEEVTIVPHELVVVALTPCNPV
uniref:Putative sugar transporter n=1 Tax=Schistosoma mansoni TaxID=6183 RepID=A0A3Q0KLZ6_SCHMA